MKAIGHPLIGDELYAPEHMLMNRQALHSAKLTFSHPMTGQEMMLECDVPDDMISASSTTCTEALQNAQPQQQTETVP